MNLPRRLNVGFAPPDGCNPEGCNPNITLLLGQVVAGQDHLIRSVDEIHHALEIRDRRMQHLDDMSSRMDERLQTLERESRVTPTSDMSETERMVVRWLVYLVPGAALLATGSWDTAAKLLTAIK